MEHKPVLLDAVLTYLDPQTGNTYLDVTAGYGGHSQAILERTGNYAHSVLIDRDQQSIKELEQEFAGKGVKIIHSDFAKASKELLEQNNSFDLILADLGVSSPHLDIASRGFSFNEDGPLDMRMDQNQSLTAEAIVNHASKEELMKILREFGDEPKAPRIAEAIIANRPVKTTNELAKIVTRTIGKSFKGAWSKVHPATRTFQALRIAVNEELDQLESSLDIWVKLLKPGGKLAVISFHSLEDRIVKQFFANRAGNTYDAELKLVTKKPIVAEHNEIVSNPRSRSAKLRVAVKINKEGDAHANQGT